LTEVIDGPLVGVMSMPPGVHFTSPAVAPYAAVLNGRT